MLFIIDIAIRRLNISFRKLDAVLEKGRNAAYKIKGSVETKLATSKQIKMPEINKKNQQFAEDKVKDKKRKKEKAGEKPEKKEKQHTDTSHISKLLESKRKRE